MRGMVFFMWQVWLIISGICLIIEILTVGFLVFWFAIGALVAMVASFFTDSIVVQSTIFLVTSVFLLFFTKSFIKRFVNKDSKTVTGSFAVIGKTGIVTKEINTNLAQGQVRIDGDIWSAKTETGEILPEGTQVKVLRLSGVKVIVEKI